MKKQFLAVCLLALAVPGCAKVKSFVGLDGGDPTPPATRSAALSLSEPVRTVVPAPGAVAATSWERNVARDIPYFNMSANALPIYTDAGRKTKIGSLAPGAGGYVQTCSDAEPVCRIAFADSSVGWVRMDKMGGVPN